LAAADRIKVAGDILEFEEFFVADDQLQYDQTGFDKRVRAEPKAVELLEETRSLVRACEPWSPETLEGQIKAMVETRGQKLGTCINAIRLALTGKTSGVGVFDAFGILGKDSSEARIDRCIQVAKQT
jgi:glutamyl-tRNA synthetase